MSEPFSAESRLIHAGSARTPGEPAPPPLVPASIYVSQGTPRPGRGYGRDGNPGWEALEQAGGRRGCARGGGQHRGHRPAPAAARGGRDPSTAELARRQMPGGFGPLLSFEIAPGGAAPDSAADKVVASSRLILPATSFGGVESTWERRARWAGETGPAGLIRLSAGVEPAADLITDIDQALEVL